MSSPARLGLFDAYGIELEYMIVDAESLNVRPIADLVLEAVGGGYELEVERGALAWSNELSLHVIEFKTNGPSPTLHGLAEHFQADVRELNAWLGPRGARLMPTGMHPWMDPERELVLWPHENDVIYQTFDRIFDCRGHGWANLQSMHINLPFGNADEFGRLHAAIRMLLPLLPALAASTPFLESRATGLFDTRVDVYRTNARAVPRVTGQVIPERVFTPEEYESDLLGPLYADLGPLDPDGILRHEWVNARGCIARFDRGALEIRLLDLQECPGADLAIAEIVSECVKALVAERTCSFEDQKRWHEDNLSPILLDCMRYGDAARLHAAPYLSQLGYTGGASCRARDLWQHLAHGVRAALSSEAKAWLDVYTREGCLSQRLISAVGSDPSRQALFALYQELCAGLDQGRIFSAATRS